MTTLSQDTSLIMEIGDRNEFPVVASDIIYEGAAVGLVTASGHAQPLTSSDQFVGFAEKKADNSSGDAADIFVRVLRRGAVKLAVTGAVITDVGLPVYASDDATFSFLKPSGVFIGFARRFVSAGYMIVEFDADKYCDPHHGLTAESVAVDKTLAMSGATMDSGKVFFVTADAKTITLPAVEGMAFRVVNGGAYGTIAVTISPNSNDMIEGCDIGGTNAKDIVNTKATANRGDYVDIEYGDGNGWIITAMKGTWAAES